MKYIIEGENFEKRPLGTLYSGRDYTGESQELGQGLYNVRQLSIGEPRSLRLEKNATLLAAEETDGGGAKKFVAEDTPDFSALGFKPQLFALVGSVSAYRGDEQVALLSPGGYGLAVLRERGADRLAVPEGLIVRFSGGADKKDEESARSFGEGEVALGEALSKFSELSVLTPWEGAALSDEELAAVTGGKGCIVKWCGAAACGYDLCPVDLCPARACGINIVPMVPLTF